MIDGERERTGSEFTVPTLVDLRLVGRLALAWLVAVSVGGLTVAILVGESDGWTITAFVAGGLLSLALLRRRGRRSIPPAIDDLTVVPGSAHVEPAIESLVRQLLLATLFAVATLSIVLLYPAVGASLAGWLAGLISDQVLMLFRLSRWEAQHGIHLRGVRETGLRSLRGNREVIAQSR